MTQATHHPVRPSLLDDGRKLSALAGVAFLVSLFLPWFQKSVLPAGAKEFVTTSLSAFGAFSWIEAALLLVDAAILLLLYLRSTGRRVELPADDGTMIAIAGGWMLVLLVVRVVFAKPEVTVRPAPPDRWPAVGPARRHGRGGRHARQRTRESRDRASRAHHSRRPAAG